MGDFEAAWRLSRSRFVDAITGLSQEQLNWRMHPSSLTLGESALHVAGVEVSFISQLLDLPLDARLTKLKLAATEGVVNDAPFPFQPEEITPEAIADALATSETMVEPVIQDPIEPVRQKLIKSALGPMIDGSGAMARLAFHAAYHQGQAHLIKTAPGFPA